MSKPLDGIQKRVKNDGQSRVGVLLIVVVAVALVLAVGAYVLLKGSGQTADPQKSGIEGGGKTKLPRMANLPAKKPLVAPPPPPSYTPDAPVLEKARSALKKGVAPKAALDLARSLPESPERADAAFLLLEYAADNGNAEAALAIGRYYDPTDGQPSGTIRKNPETAYDWYKASLKGGQQEATRHLQRLRQWLEKQAQQGSQQARELLNGWR
jgi:hypothetical protein